MSCHGHTRCNPRRHRLGRILPSSTDTARASIGLASPGGLQILPATWIPPPKEPPAADRSRLRSLDPVRHRRGLQLLQRRLTRSYPARTAAERLPPKVLDHARQTDRPGGKHCCQGNLRRLADTSTEIEASQPRSEICFSPFISFDDFHGAQHISQARPFLAKK